MFRILLVFTPESELTKMIRFESAVVASWEMKVFTQLIHYKADRRILDYIEKQWDTQTHVYEYAKSLTISSSHTHESFFFSSHTHLHTLHCYSVSLTDIHHLWHKAYTKVGETDTPYNMTIFYIRTAIHQDTITVTVSAFMWFLWSSFHKQQWHLDG